MAEHRPPILWSPEALDDIDHLWDYYARAAGPVTADKIIREIAKVVTTIDDFPLAGRMRDEIRPGLRSLTVTPQIVPFEKRPTGNCACARRTTGYRRDF